MPLVQLSVSWVVQPPVTSVLLQWVYTRSFPLNSREKEVFVLSAKSIATALSAIMLLTMGGGLNIFFLDQLIDISTTYGPFYFWGGSNDGYWCTFGNDSIWDDHYSWFKVLKSNQYFQCHDTDFHSDMFWSFRSKIRRPILVGSPCSPYSCSLFDEYSFLQMLHDLLL